MKALSGKLYTGLLCASVIWFNHAAWADVTLAAHKAIYDVKLLSAKSGSQIANITGKMTYAWQPSCDGYITNHKFALHYDYAENGPMDTQSHFTVFETKDGKELQFLSRELSNDELDQIIRGHASNDKAVFQYPEDVTLNLPSGTIFPTEQTSDVIAAAQKGQKIVNRIVFDGSELTGAQEINAVILPRKISSLYLQGKSPKDFSKIKKELVAGASWQVDMAAFPQDNMDAKPDYEMSAILHENGIISDMIIKYPDFTLSEKLVSLEKIKTEDCRPLTKD